MLSAVGVTLGPVYRFREGQYQFETKVSIKYFSSMEIFGSHFT